MKRLSRPAHLLAALAIILVAAPRTRAEPGKAPDQKEIINAVEKSFGDKKYAEALTGYTAFLKTYGKNMPDEAGAALHLRIASCQYFLKKWADTEAELELFLKEYKDGAGALFGASNMRKESALMLAEVKGRLEKYDEGVVMLKQFANSGTTTLDERLAVMIYVTELLEKKALKGDPGEKKRAAEEGVLLLKPLISSSPTNPEVRRGGYRLSDLYGKAGMVKESEQLRRELDSKITNPVDLVRSNFLKIELGDRYFTEAEQIPEPADPRRLALYKNAIEAYQGVYRREAMAAFMTKALAAAEESLKKAGGVVPEPGTTPKIKVDAAGEVVDPGKDKPPAVREAEEALESVKKLAAAFEGNANYDSDLSYRLGLCLVEMHLPWEACIAFREIIDKNPNYPKADSAYYWYILSLASTRRMDLAKSECEKFIAKFPKSEWRAHISIKLAEVLADDGDPIKALDQYKWVKANVTPLPEGMSMAVDGAIAQTLFALLRWEDARTAIDTHLSAHPSADQRTTEILVYMRALTHFFEGKDYRTAKAAFEDYAAKYPTGVYNYDLDYRYALFVLNQRTQDPEKAIANAVEAGNRAEAWLKTHGSSTVPEVKAMLAPIYNLLADAQDRIAKAPGVPPDKAVAARKATTDYHIKTVENVHGNKAALDAALREINKTLPAAGEWARLGAIYDKLYAADPNSPEALGYLIWKVRCTERKGKTPEEREQRIAETKQLFADAILKNINDPAQENVESLIIELASRLAREARLREKQNRDHPEKAVAHDIDAEIERILKLKENRDSLLAQARGYFARAEVHKAMRKPDLAGRQFDTIARLFKPEELSPTILGITGEHLLAQGKTKEAFVLFTYLKDFHRSSHFADFGVVGAAQILLDQGKPADALAMLTDALENGLAYGKLKELTFLKARALVETGKFEEAKTLFTQISGVKAWRGEATAGSAYHLALIEEHLGKSKEAHLMYQACYLKWSRYQEYAVKSIHGAARLLADKLNDRKGAADTLDQQLFKNPDSRTADRYKTASEWALCRKLRDRL